MTPPLVIPPYLKEAPLTGLIGMGGGATSRRFYTASSSDEYQIGKSLRFNPGDAPYLKRSVSTQGNRRTWTISFWIKVSEITDEYPTIFSAAAAANTNDHMIIRLEHSDGSLKVDERTSSSSSYSLQTSALHRDFSAWYHFVIAFDSTQATDTERLKIFQNGVLQELSGSYPDQNYESHWNESSTYTNNHVIGREAARSDYETSGYLADVQLIDGLALSPAAFGSFNSANCWNPKTFALPAPNDGTTWSGKITAKSGSFHGSHPATYAFNGLLSNFAGEGSNGAGNGLVFTPDNAFEGVSTLRFYAESVGANMRFRVHDGDSWGDYNEDADADWNGSNTAWRDISAFIPANRKVKQIEYESLAGGHAFIGAIEVNGVILVDSQTDETDRTNIWPKHNDGTTWIENADVTFSGNGYGSSPPVNAFDGDLTTAMNNNAGGQTITWDCTTAFSRFSNKKLRLYCTGSDYDIYVNGSDTGTNGPASASWVDLGTFASITELKFYPPGGGSAGFNLYAVEIDGCVLINAATDQSFHFKFNDTSRVGALGKDTLNGKIEDATGGLPIYNTKAGTNDNLIDYGDVKDTGYREEASNTIRDALVLAIPGDSVASGTCDVHQQINTGSSNKTVTVNGSVTVKTDESRLYGSSLYFAGDEDDLQFADHADFDVGTGDFTIEFWANPTNTGAWSSIVSWPGSWDSTAQRIAFSDAGKFACGNTTTGNHIGDTVCWDGHWRHFAVVRNGTSFKGYVNGVEEFSFTTSASYDFGGLVIGRYPPSSYPSDYEYKGYVNDFRFYKGLAKYTANFKPAYRNDFTVNNINHASSTGTTTGGSWDLAFRKDGVSQFATRDDWDISSGDSMSTNGNSQVAYCDTQSLGDSYELTVEDTGGANDIYLATTASATSTSWSLVKNNNTKLIFTPGGVSCDGVHYTHERYVRFEGAGSGHVTITITGTLDLDAGTSPTAGGIDVVTDSPTNYGTDAQAGGEVRGNYCTWNPLTKTLPSPTNGNLNSGTAETAGWRGMKGTFGITTGKWYYEAKITGMTSDQSNGYYIGLGTNDCANNSVNQTGQYTRQTTTTVQNGSYNHTDFTTPAVNEIHGIAIDMDAKKMWISTDGTWEKSGNPATGANPHITIDSSHNVLFPFVQIYGSIISMDCNFGQRPWEKTCPSGFNALCTQNLSDTFGDNDDTNNPSKYFEPRAYTGTGAVGREVGGMNFQPDLVWIKSRSATYDHAAFDAIRGANKRLRPNTQDSEGTDTQTLTAFNSDGYTTGSDEVTNKDGDNYISWNWDAGTAAATPSTDGTITPDAQWINATSGFSLIKYTGTAANATIGHGLSSAPDFMILKDYTAGSTDWQAWHSSLNGTQGLQITTGAAFTQSDMWNDTAPTDSVIHLGSGNGTNKSGESIMLYAWTAVPGYSAFGSYTGTGNADGPFVYTGFKPAFIIFKRTDGGPTDWIFLDAGRHPYNENDLAMFPNTNSADATQQDTDFLSNGFKLRNTSGGSNGSTKTYSYSAWAEHPFKTSRAR